MNNSERFDMLFIYWEFEINSRLATHVYVVRYPSIYILVSTLFDLVILVKIIKHIFYTIEK